MPTVGLSYEAMVRLRLMHKKCPKGVQEAKLRADLWGLLGTLHGGREDRKGVRIRNASEERKNLALGRGQTKLTEQC